MPSDLCGLVIAIIALFDDYIYYYSIIELR